MRLVDLRETPLDVAEVLAALDDEASGGLTLFVGRVRDHDHGLDVRGLEYSAHPTALEALRRVCDRVAEEYDVHGVAAVHRVGPARDRRHRGRRRDHRRPPRRGVRGLAGADRHPQGRGADLEAPAVRRRHRRVGRHALTASHVRGAPRGRRRRGAYPDRVEILWWLAPPVVATALAMLWVSWLGREGRGEVDPRRRRAPARRRHGPSHPVSRAGRIAHAGPGGAQHRGRRTAVQPPVGDDPPRFLSTP